MKSLIKKIALISCLTVGSVSLFAQIPPQAPPPPPTGPAAPPAPGMPPAPGPGLAQPPLQGNLRTLTTISGKVTAYLANDRGIYDGFTLQSSGQSYTVRFADYLGEKLMATAKKGAYLSVSGFADVDPQGINAFHLVSAKAGSTVITDTPPPAPAVPPVQDIKNYSGSITDFRKDMQGNINGVILGNKEIVQLPPPVIAQLQGLLKSGEKIEVTGFRVIPPAGAIMAEQNTLIDPQTITLNGQTYLVR